MDSQAKPKSISNIIIFCITFLLSAFGYEFLFFILTVHVYDITHKAFTVGIFITITFFPKIFSPFYGVLVDRYDRKIVLGINAGVVCILVFALGFMNRIIEIYILWFVATIFIMFINNARTALMTEVMPKDNYLWGNSTVLVILNAAKLLAPLMAGLIMQWMDKKVLIVFSSGVYLLCMIMSLMIKLEKRDKIELKKFNDTFLRIKDGIRYILTTNDIKILGTVGIFWRLFLGMQFSLFVVYITKYLGRSNAEYGVFMTVVALGSLIGSLIGPFVAKRLSERVLILTGLTLHFLSFSLLGLVNQSNLSLIIMHKNFLFGLLGLVNQYNLSLIIMFISFMIFYITIVGIHSVRDKLTKANIRGTVYGAITAILTPPTIISMLIAGYMADVYGVEKVFIVSGVLAAVSLVLIIFSFKLSIKIKWRVIK